jgi:hypothetical protein
VGYKQIRIGQLIAPFGPGGIYTDRRGIPHVVAGLDHWFQKWDNGLARMIQCSDRSEFERAEARLSALLHVDRFCLPPDYRHVSRGSAPPPNAGLHVPALRFPRWYRHTRTGEMRRFNLHTAELARPVDAGRWQPVRFIAVCAAGHLCEFPWKQWLGCQCADSGKLFLIDRGGSELTSVRVECRSCPDGSEGRRGRNIAGTTVIPDGQKTVESAFEKEGIFCPGDKPWLGEGANDANCKEALVGALINQTNIYFPRTMSAISLPDLQPRDEAVVALSQEIEREQGVLGTARTLWKMGLHREAAAVFRQTLADRQIAAELDAVLEALKLVYDASPGALPPGAATPIQPESELVAFRRAEFNTLRIEINDAASIPNLTVIPTAVEAGLTQWIERVTLVERLRETRVFYGFDRLKPSAAPLGGMPEQALTQLFRAPPGAPQDRWLPAVEIFGEGIYLELREPALATWVQGNSLWLSRRLDEAYRSRLSGIFQALPPQGLISQSWASRFLIVHSLAHILINQLVFECGYSTASLRERLFVSDDPSAPMAALLIYTAAGDADGTLGGLVRLGRPERFGAVLRRALDRASWCSADPVCSEHLGGTGSRLVNLAACHACVLLPETSCETINQGLDRAMVIGTPDDRSRGFMSSLLGAQYTLD